MNASLLRALPALLCASLLLACTVEVADHLGDDSQGHLLILDGHGAGAEALQAPLLHLRSAEPVHTIALWVEGLAEGEAAGVAWRPAGGSWEPLELTHAEETLTLWRADSAQPWREAELRGVRGASFLHVEAHPHRIDRTRPLARELPFAGTTQRFDQRKRLPPEVVTREEWNAREPACDRTPHTPSRMAVHHTVTGTPDSLSAPARMRGMQNHHIDGREWCDIGYHFVVGHDDRVYQAAIDERRQAAHVGGHNQDNVGFSFMGTFTHVQPSVGQFEAAARMIAWIGTTYDIPIDREHILGHREHAGAATECPGTSLFPRMNELVSRAAEIAGEPPLPPPTTGPPVEIDLRAELDVDDSRIPAGRRAGSAQLLPGDLLTWDVRMTNRSTEVLRGTLLGLHHDAGFLRVRDWRIESDHPAYDEENWGLNSADGEESNPPRAAVPAQSVFAMHAFSPGETKRLVLTVEALRPVPLEQDALRLQAWLRNVDGVYVSAEEWDAAPSLNRVGEPVRAERGVQILSRDGWRFAGVAGAADDEGWQPCADGGTLAEGDAGGGALRLDAGERICVESPVWTRMDTAQWEELVVRVAEPVDAGALRLRWDVGQGWEAVAVAPERALEDALVFAPAGAPGWGEVLERIELSTEGAEPARVALRSVYLQDSEDVRVSAPGEPWIGQGEVVWPEESEPGASEPAPSVPGGSTSPGASAPDDSAADPTERTPPVRRPDDGASMQTVTYRTTESGCAQASGGSPAGAALLWLTLVGMALARGRREERG